MPTTTLQRVVYAFLTVLITVHLFVFYNVAIERGGMTNHVFIDAEIFVPVEVVIAFLLEILLVGKLANKMAFSIVDPKVDRPYAISLAIICSTVVFMCPMMSFANTIIHNGITVEFFAQWFQKIVINFPFAIFTQIFFVQPIVTKLFGIIFRKQLDNSHSGHMEDSIILS